MPTARVLSEDETKAHAVSALLLRQVSVVGIKVSVSRDFWPNASNYADLDLEVKGEITRWVNKKDLSLSIKWIDGLETAHLKEILHSDFNFKVVSGPNGGPLPRMRGGAAAAAAADGDADRGDHDPVDATYVEVPYKIGSLECIQKWKVEPRDIIKDVRTAGDWKPKLRKVDVAHTKTPLQMARNVTVPKTMIAKMVKFCNQRLPGSVSKTDHQLEKKKILDGPKGFWNV